MSVFWWKVRVNGAAGGYALVQRCRGAAQQVLSQDGAVDGGQGVCSREGKGEHTEVAAREKEPQEEATSYPLWSQNRNHLFWIWIRWPRILRRALNSTFWPHFSH